MHSACGEERGLVNHKKLEQLDVQLDQYMTNADV